MFVGDLIGMLSLFKKLSRTSDEISFADGCLPGYQ